MAPVTGGPGRGCRNYGQAGARPPTPRMHGSAEPEPIPLEITDRRSGRVAFVSHCLLNQNVRYLGGATEPGVLPDVVGRYSRAGIGIVQMPCPEQHAWGGVLKPTMTRWYGSRLLRRRTARRLVARMAGTWTEHRYRRLARRAVAAIVDYQQGGMEVVEVLGVGASPSCGVTTSIDLEGALAAMGRLRRSTVDASAVNRRVVEANTVTGSGLFISCLQAEMRRRGVIVPFREHNLLEELRQAGSLPRGPGEADGAFNG